MVEFLSRIGVTLGRLQRFENLTPDSTRVSDALCKVFIEYLDFARQTRLLFKRQENRSRNPLKSISSKVLRASIWGTFKEDTNVKIAKIKDLCDETEREAYLAATEGQVGHARQTSDFIQRQHVKESNSEEKERQEKLKAELIERKALLRDYGQWLAPVPTVDDFERVKKTQLEGSCSWIDDNAQISHWLNASLSDNQLKFLWISGIPGSGKTFLSAHIVERLQRSQQVAYFFCDTKDQSKRTMLSVLRTWIWQLLILRPDLEDNLTDPYWKGEASSKSNLSRVLIDHLEKTDSCWIILDGLDECYMDDRKELLELCGQISGHCKILIASRDEADIRLGIKEAVGSVGFAHTRITEKDNEKDIHSYLRNKVKYLTVGDDDLKIRITKELSSGADGMFLWVRLMLEHLNRQRSIAGIEKALTQLPKGLDAIYGRILDDIIEADDNVEIAHRIFQWIICATRPLTLAELDVALAMTTGENHFNDKMRIWDLRNVVSQICGTLIGIDESSNIIRLIHASVKDFLLSTSYGGKPFASLLVNTGLANDYITRICLTYLCYDTRSYVEIDSDEVKAVQRFEKHLNDNRFLEYSAINWCQHLVSRSDVSDDAYIRLLCRFVHSEPNVVKWLQVFHYLHTDRRVGANATSDLVTTLISNKSSTTSGLHYILPTFKSSWSGTDFQSIVSHIGWVSGGRFSRWQRLLVGVDVPRCFSPIIMAGHFDFVNLVKEMVQNGASVDSRSLKGGTTLFFAARTEATDTVKYLLDSGADLHDQSHAYGSTALAMALYMEGDLQTSPGSYSLVRTLLQAGANPNILTAGHDSPLHDLIRNRNDSEVDVSVAKDLLAHGADIRILNGDGATAILDAAACNLPRMVRVLLDHGRHCYGEDSLRAILEMPNRGQRTALHAACAIKNSLVVESLCDAGANVNKREGLNYMTPLHLAIQGALSAVPVLLRHGADVNARDVSGNLPLHFAARRDLGDLIRLILDRGSEINTKNSSGSTPLDIALVNYSTNACKVLIKAGAISSKGSDIGALAERSSLGPQKSNRDVRRGSATPERNPATLHDIFHAFFILQHCSPRILPTSIVSRVLHLAEYWLEHSYQRQDHIRVVQHDTSLEYLSTAPIQGRCNKVQKIIFTTFSNDQGFSSYPDYHGTYTMSWTWFEARRSRATDEQDAPGLEISRNIHASSRTKTHTAEWIRGDDEDTVEDERRTLVRSLEAGDVVQVVPRALFPGWVNHVHGVQIRIFTTPVAG